MNYTVVLEHISYYAHDNQPVIDNKKQVWSMGGGVSLTTAPLAAINSLIDANGHEN